MDYEKPLTKRFMSKYDRYEPTVRDSTTIRSAKTCKRLYFYERVLGFRPKETAPYFAFGSCYHKFREVLEITQDFKQALTTTAELWKKIGGDPPIGTRWDFLTARRLVLSCHAAKEWWDKEKSNGNIEVLASEQIFQVLLKDGKTVIGGRADQLVEWNGKLWGRDFKTSSKLGKFYERTLEPNDQFTRYTLGEGKLKGERVEGQIVEVLYNTKEEGPKVIPFITSRSPEQLDRWEDEQIFYEKILKLMRDEDCYPMEESHCPFCKFHSVCKQSSESSMMTQLDNFFTQVPWNFYNVGQAEVEE